MVQRRRQVLENLGYDLFDFDLYTGWLILEESSAERIIREYLIPWYTPNLIGKLRTCAARGSGNVNEKLRNLHDLFLFLHLQPMYDERAWVLIDSGTEERHIIDKLKKDFIKDNNRWSDKNFRQLSKHDFEEYYPKEFKEKSEIREIIDLSDTDKKRFQKEKLLDQLVEWIKMDNEKAKDSFRASASDVIDILQEIDLALNSVT